METLPTNTPPVVEVHDFLDLLAKRLGMVKRGGVTDHTRAATWFIKWWRDQGGHVAAKTPLVPLLPENPTFDVPTSHRRGWGFDFEWSVDQQDLKDNKYDEQMIQSRMEECIDAFEAAAQEEEAEGGGVSSTQQKKKERDQLLAKRAARSKARLAAKRGGF